MKTYTKEELIEVLRLHNLWLNDVNGTRADLSGANLTRANLTRANLYGADLTGAYLSFTKISEDEYLIKSIFINGSKHSVSWWGMNMISIGCHRKEIDWWKDNYNTVGKREGYTPEQCEEYLTYILICEQMQKIPEPMTYSEASDLIDRLDSLLFEKHQTNSPLAGELKNIVKSFLAGQADIEYWKRFIENEIKSLEDENN